MPKGGAENFHAIPPGRSIMEELWEDLDGVVDELMDGEATDELRGEAKGLARAIARMMQSYHPDVDAVREISMERRQRREATGRSVPAVQHKWEKGDVAYHRGRRLEIESVGIEFAYVSGPSRSRFNVPVEQLRTEEEEHA